jgi:hypothetical protein
MKFFIQVGSPTLAAGTLGETAADFSEAITFAYAKDTEPAVLSWNHVLVAIDYHYDVSVMAEDVVDLLEELEDPGFPETCVNWGSSTFQGQWAIRATLGDLVLTSWWGEVHGSYEFLLNERSELTVNGISSSPSGKSCSARLSPTWKRRTSAWRTP